MSGHAKCVTCGAAMEWVALTSGQLHPAEPVEQPPEAAAPGMVLVSPRTGKGIVLAEADMASVAGWMRQGARLLVSHFRSKSCALATRVHPGQETLL